MGETKEFDEDTEFVIIKCLTLIFTVREDDRTLIKEEVSVRRIRETVSALFEILGF